MCHLDCPAGALLGHPPAPFLGPVFSQATLLCGPPGAPPHLTAPAPQSSMCFLPAPAQAPVLAWKGRRRPECREECSAVGAVPMPGLPGSVSMFTFKQNSPPCPASEDKNHVAPQSPRRWTWSSAIPRTRLQTQSPSHIISSWLPFPFKFSKN